jgi:hypothetical protein
MDSISLRHSPRSLSPGAHSDDRTVSATTLKVDLSTNTAVAQLTMQSSSTLQRALRIRLDGGAENDTLSALVSNTAAATFLDDTGVNGREGVDILNFTGANNGGAVIDGSLGVDAVNVTTSGGFQTRVVS